VKSKYGRSAQFRPNMTVLVQFRPHLTVLVPNFCFFWKGKFFPNMMTDPTNYVSPGPGSLVQQPLVATSRKSTNSGKYHLLEKRNPFYFLAYFFYFSATFFTFQLTFYINFT
jgi:hypothetical protein